MPRNANENINLTNTKLLPMFLIAYHTSFSEGSAAAMTAGEVDKLFFNNHTRQEW